ncbi:unnamed protein product [Durusdinium trenchii]|uniref:Uncharacterized protein n=2 Tax=Durusdinium trenchii TaxID=1381693 RepID=A0ABP0S0B7_9DINO
MAPAVPSLRVQRLEELQRQQSIELQQILLRSSPNTPRRTATVASPHPPRSARSTPTPPQRSTRGAQTPTVPWTPRETRKRTPKAPQVDLSPKVQDLLKLLDSIPVGSEAAFAGLKVARAGFLRLANEFQGLQQRLMAQDRLQEELQTSLVRHGGGMLKDRLQEERLRYDDHIQALSAAEKEKRSNQAEQRLEQFQSFADRLENQAADFRQHFAHVKEVRALDRSIQEDLAAKERLASLQELVEAKRAQLKELRRRRRAQAEVQAEVAEVAEGPLLESESCELPTL